MSFLKTLWDSVTKHVETKSGTGVVNMTDFVKSLRTAGLVGLAAFGAELIRAASTDDWGAAEPIMITVIGFGLDFVHRWMKDNGTVVKN